MLLSSKHVMDQVTTTILFLRCLMSWHNSKTVTCYGGAILIPCELVNEVNHEVKEQLWVHH